MRRDARTRKQNGKPELPIQRIPQRGESRGLIGFVVHRFVTGPKLELVENMTDLYPGAEFGLAARRLRQCLREGASMQRRSCESIQFNTFRL
ncbi:MAG: hypothetical protein QOH31_3429 [Verrucomicrobiota bacterium]